MGEADSERRGRGKRKRGKELERTALDETPNVFVLLWLEKRSGEESLSEVTHGWMFIFRAVNYLRRLCVRA